LVYELLFVDHLPGATYTMTAFDILVGVPLILLFVGGWPALVFYALRRHTSLSEGLSVGLAFFVGIAFVFFESRFTASVPSYTFIPMTPEQRTIERIGIFLVVLPYVLLFTLLALKYWRKRIR
jgi:hypothetical protein